MQSFWLSIILFPLIAKLINRPKWSYQHRIFCLVEQPAWEDSPSSISPSCHHRGPPPPNCWEGWAFPTYTTPATLVNWLPSMCASSTPPPLFASHCCYNRCPVRHCNGHDVPNKLALQHSVCTPIVICIIAT